MFSKVTTCSLYGLDACKVDVETDLAGGLPAFHVVGLPDTAVRESKERIRAAIRNAGYRFPVKRITVNLSPADTKKAGTHFDLPIALGILLAEEGPTSGRRLREFGCIGELSLDGRVLGIRGVLPLVLGMRSAGIRSVILPETNVVEASVVDDMALYPVASLEDALDRIRAPGAAAVLPDRSRTAIIPSSVEDLDFSDVAGQESAKRALQIAALAAHNILLAGPPGSGKTMLARRLPGILPPLSHEEKLEITKIYSVAGELKTAQSIVSRRPFRAPHHTLTKAALTGGGLGPRPGEISLAHLGVLFFDELPEFDRSVLESLREPMEEGFVTISRVNGMVRYPAGFLFAAGMNLCPCGHSGDPSRACTCTAGQIAAYMGRLSGPLMDRIDMHVEVLPQEFHAFERHAGHRSSEVLRREVEEAFAMQRHRFKDEAIKYNSKMTSSMIDRYCKLDASSKRLLEEAFRTMALSARAHAKIIRLSRTIADLECSDDIRLEHVAEAISYRKMDRRLRR